MHWGKNEAEQLLTATQTYLFRFRISLQTHLFGSCLWCLRQERAWVITQFRVTCAKGHTAPIPQSQTSTSAVRQSWKGRREISSHVECHLDDFPRQMQLLNHLVSYERKPLFRYNQIKHIHENEGCRQTTQIIMKNINCYTYVQLTSRFVPL